MTFKKLILCFFCFIFAVSLIEAKNGGGQSTTKVVQDSIYEIPKATVAPVIDGYIDPIWKTLDWNFQRSYDNGTGEPDSWADLFGAHKLMWDEEFIYGLFYSQDDILVDQHANAWERDAVEFYFDSDNSKGAAFDGVNDFQLGFRHEFIGAEDAADISWDITTTPKDGTLFRIVDDTTNQGGYWLEFRLPVDGLALIPEAGMLVGVEWQQNDNDGTARDHISKWWLETGDDSWQIPGHWGTGILSARQAGESVEIKKVPDGTTITIDGVMDDIFTDANRITQNSLSNGTSSPDDFHDSFLTSYVLYDDENFYGFFEVYDDVIVDQHANAWERDAVELYFDADNSKAAAFDNVNDFQLGFRHEFIGAEDAADISWDIASTPKEGTMFRIVDTDLGFNIEMRLPWDALAVSVSEGQPIGFEIQINDNDGTARDHISKWWLQTGDDSWQRPDHWGTAYLGSQITTAVDDHGVELTSFALQQNYPNPFNPSTKITYSVAKSDHVKLTVYNVLGKEVAVLVNESQNAGEYSVNFNANNLSSGIYFYRLEAGNTMLVNKMVLLK